jgi:hypothetical protein
MARTKKTARIIWVEASKMSAVNHLGFSTSHLDEEKPSDDEDSVEEEEELSNSDDDKKPAAIEENQETNGLESAGEESDNGLDNSNNVKPSAGSIDNESKETKEKDSVMNEDGVNNEQERIDLPDALSNEENEVIETGIPVNEDANIDNLPAAPIEEVEVEADQQENVEVVVGDPPVPPVVPTIRYLLQFRDQVSPHTCNITNAGPVCLFSHHTYFIGSFAIEVWRRERIHRT